MPEKTKAKPDPADLEAAIDALLAEIDATCSRFENPVATQEDQDLAEYTQAVTAVRKVPVMRAAATEPVADVGDPAVEAEAAIDSAGQTAEALLDQAADDLIGSLEAEVEAATPEAGPEPGAELHPLAETESASTDDAADGPEPQPDGETNDALLTEALDALIAETTAPDVPESPDASTEPKPEAKSEAAPEPESESESEPESEPEPESDSDLSAMSTEIDDLLDGSFESADGEAVDTEGVDTAPDPALMLDSGDDANAANAAAQSPEPVRAPPAETVVARALATPAPEPPVVGTPATASVAAAAPGPPAPRITRPARAGKKGKALDLLIAVGVWITPRLRSVGGSAAAVAKPVAARGLMLLSKPLEGRPPAVRDSIGWVAIWTLFLAVCVWASLAMRKPDTPRAEVPGTRVMTAADAE